MPTTIDLIMIEYTDGREMSCAIIYETDHSKDKLLGPVDNVGAVKALAPLLIEECPEQFPTIRDAETFLTMTHFRNISLHQNSAGQSYPFKINAPKPAK